MKKLLLLLFILLLPCFALAEDLRIYQTTGEYDRVKLRESPGGRVIGQYYNDVLVTPIKREGDWTYISIGGREGWMMSEFLLPADEEWQASEGWAGQGVIAAPFRAAPDTLPDLYAEPVDTSAVLLRLDTDMIEVLGTVDDDWLHLRVTRMDGQVVYGYASAWQITWTENLATADVDTGDAVQRLNLREAPSTSARKRAELYNGTEVYFLFDDHVNDDGWSKVRVGGLTGYVSIEYLNYSSAGVLAFEPPLCLLENGHAAQVLAVRDGEVYVHPLGNIHAKDYFWISINSASCYTPRSASTSAVTNREVTVIERDIILPKGHPVEIHGSFNFEADSHAWGYIRPGDTQLYVDFAIPGSPYGTSGYLPVDSVNFDPLLLAPTGSDLSAPSAN